jgi:hypothetical protein
MPKKSPSVSAETAATPRSAKAPRDKRSPAPTHDKIALRAYHIYLQRNGAPGSPFEDWKRAEQELLAECAKPQSRRKSKVVPFAA